MNTPNQNPSASPAKAADVTAPAPPASNVSPLFTPVIEAAKAPLNAAKGTDEVVSQSPKAQS